MEELKDFKILYQQHQSYVRSILYRLVGPNLVDDAVQECFLKVWKSRDNFKGESSLKTWIHRIAINVAHDLHRSKKREVQTEKEQDTVSIEDQDRNWTQIDLQRALMELSMEYRVVVVLSLFEELSLKEVSDSLNIPEGTVKSRLSRGKDLMKEILENWGYKV